MLATGYGFRWPFFAEQAANHGSHGCSKQGGSGGCGPGGSGGSSGGSARGGEGPGPDAPRAAPRAQAAPPQSARPAGPTASGHFVVDPSEPLLGFIGFIGFVGSGKAQGSAALPPLAELQVCVHEDEKGAGGIRGLSAWGVECSSTHGEIRATTAEQISTR